MMRPAAPLGSTSDKRLSELRQSLSLGAVAVVGAGLSIAARFPGTAGLDALLHESLDHSWRNAGGPAPSTLDSQTDLHAAWVSLAADADARSRFQRQFTTIDRARSQVPSPAHEGLARLIHAGVVETVVSLNWDTALEAAYIRLYGASIPEGVLFKPHGDCAYPDSNWVLPHEDGRVTELVKTKVAELVGDHARTLMIMGYSESDETVSRDLIGPVSARWTVVRIGPAVTGPTDIPLPADEALIRLTADITSAEESNSWHTVTFAGSRGLAAALAGERLGPADVDACPRFSEVARIIDALAHRHAVVLNGPSGSGKSITAYQALRELSRTGIEVLRLRDSVRKNTTSSWMSDLKSFAQRKVLFIDDAQDISADVVRELAESANAYRMVLIVGVDQVAGGVTTVTISSASAVAQLAHYVRTNSSTLLPIISALDDQIGEGLGDTSLEFRLGAAEVQSSPWLFFHVLTGGWRRAQRQAIELRDDNRADLALTAVAVAQVAGVDAGVTRSELVGLLDILERDEDWLDKSLHTLTSLRAVTVSDGRLRCPHLQTAYHVIHWMLHPPAYKSPPHRPAVVRPIASAGVRRPVMATHKARPVERSPELPKAAVAADQTVTSALIGRYLDLPSTPLRGCTWLAGRGLVGESRQVLKYTTQLLDDARWGQLAERAIACPDGSSAEGAQLLAEALTWAPDPVRLLIGKHHQSVAKWFQQLTPQNAWALADVLNGLYSHDYREGTEESKRIAIEVTPMKLSTLLLDGGWGHIYSTSRGVERIITAGGDDLRKAVTAALDRPAYIQFLKSSPDDLDVLAEFVKGTAACDRPFAISLFEMAAQKFAHLYARNPAQGWSDIFDVLAFVLGFAPEFLRGRRKPIKEARAAARRFATCLNLETIARSLAEPGDEWARSSSAELIHFLAEASPKVLRQLIAAVDLEHFEEAMLRPENQGDNVFYAVVFFWDQRQIEVRAMLERLEPSLQHLSPYVALITPDVAFKAMRRGLPLNLGTEHQRWGFSTAILKSLSSTDRALTREVLDANLDGIVEGLAGNFSDPFEGLAGWVTLVDTTYPGYIEMVLESLPEGAVRKWAQSLRRSKRFGQSRRKEILPLVSRAREIPGHVGREAQDLVERFPSLAKQIDLQSRSVRAEK